MLLVFFFGRCFFGQLTAYMYCPAASDALAGKTSLELVVLKENFISYLEQKTEPNSFVETLGRKFHISSGIYIDLSSRQS